MEQRGLKSNSYDDKVCYVLTGLIRRILWLHDDDGVWRDQIYSDEFCKVLWDNVYAQGEGL